MYKIETWGSSDSSKGLNICLVSYFENHKIVHPKLYNRMSNLVFWDNNASYFIIWLQAGRIKNIFISTAKVLCSNLSGKKNWKICKISFKKFEANSRWFLMRLKSDEFTKEMFSAKVTCLQFVTGVI